MPGAFVRFGLAGGGTLEISDESVKAIYDELWARSSQRGAVTVAALLLDEFRKPDTTRRTVELTEAQSALLRDAVARLA